MVGMRMTAPPRCSYWREYLEFNELLNGILRRPFRTSSIFCQPFHLQENGFSVPALVAEAVENRFLSEGEAAQKFQIIDKFMAHLGPHLFTTEWTIARAMLLPLDFGFQIPPAWNRLDDLPANASGVDSGEQPCPGSAAMLGQPLTEIIRPANVMAGVMQRLLKVDDIDCPLLHIPLAY